ncbi:type II toxin-antitoxin system RelE/ParE family toxin [uncultured Mucilaginibacter sp.]|uniref:type II toxin-antitoxin system RelE family toxin n=1 Tax=uncultured Mucilaginibacter sp. TaxID=797541 RepID=UPI002600C915|nr:type II toxin-antitoxin system RelE/ParE family toxin [uncultured Mucilaginibacter sp.]
MSYDIITIPNFDRELKKLSKKYHSIKDDLTALIKSLKQNPLQGESLGKDCYKVRMKISSKKKGKSGGSRVITCVKIVNQEITLISIYDKSEQDSVSDSFLTQLLVESDLL